MSACSWLLLTQALRNGYEATQCRAWCGALRRVCPAVVAHRWAYGLFPSRCFTEIPVQTALVPQYSSRQYVRTASSTTAPIHAASAEETAPRTPSQLTVPFACSVDNASCAEFRTRVGRLLQWWLLPLSRLLLLLESSSPRQQWSSYPHYSLLALPHWCRLFFEPSAPTRSFEQLALSRRNRAVRWSSTASVRRAVERVRDAKLATLPSTCGGTRRYRSRIAKASSTYRTTLIFRTTPPCRHSLIAASRLGH